MNARPLPDAVAPAFDVPDAAARQGLLALREMILDEAGHLPQIGRVEEALRWGQPAYLTPDTKAGSSLRLGVPRTGGFGLYVHCRTTLIADYKEMFPHKDRIEGTRAVLFDDPAELSPDRQRWLIRRALTYHL